MFAALALAACAPALEYPPPPQKAMPTGPEPLPGATLVRMSDPAVDGAIVKDVLGGEAGSAWRWTNQHPRVKVWFQPGLPAIFYVRFTLAGVVLKETGPITVRVMVNDRLLDTRTYSAEREYEYSKPVPPEMLGSNDSAVLGLDLDPVYVSPRDGAKLGVLLQEIGLKQAGAE